MESGKILKKSLPYIAIILTAVIARIIPHAPNFAPIGGLALFTGYHFRNKFSWLLPIAAMVVSDAIIGFHSTIPYVYASFLAISILGSIIKKGKGSTLLTASILSSAIFYLVTNFGVWATGTMYVKNANGLLQSYLMGIPFLRNTVLSDAIYSFTFFYGFDFLSRFIVSKKFEAKSA